MKHNKSGQATLSILTMNETLLTTHHAQLLDDRVDDQLGPIKGSHCLFTKAQDGRYSANQKKICFGYQLTAWDKFGRRALNAVPSNKTNRNDLVISHLCGNGPRCCNPDHLVLEEKWKNDERTHCHFCLHRIQTTQGTRKAIKTALKLGLCPHTPPCYTSNK